MQRIENTHLKHAKEMKERIKMRDNGTYEVQ